MISAKTESTPHVAKANSMENTATTTIKFEASALDGSVTLFRNSSTDSLMYVIMIFPFSSCIRAIVVPCSPHGRRDSNSRHLVLETSALPTELHP